VDANDERRLALAAKVWRATRPSDREVEQHVVRVARRLRTAKRHHPLRRFLAFLIAIVSFGGALAFAASGAGILRWPGQDGLPKKAAVAGGRAPARAAEPPSASRTSGEPRQAQDESSALSDESGIRSMPEPSGAAGSATPAPSGAGSAEAPAGNAEGRTSAAPAAKTGNSAAAETRLWHTVSSALAKDDLTTAAAALRQLATGGSPETRTKARLGLVQLAVSRGDCDRAERLAKGLAADRSTDDKVVSRALSAARTCFGR
jgi:hypothetical protein